MLHCAPDMSINTVLFLKHHSGHVLQVNHIGLSLDTLAQQGNQPSEIPTDLPKSEEDMAPWENGPSTGRAGASAGHSHLTVGAPGPKGKGFLGTAKG